ncbi:protein of unknown function [Georgfuchsia toluolica]|uniref:Uncharacterized protein n=1 Tax=Georgfuchsia toluolica TaxID=424218 RepID=A0A916J520_9PROT|nr:protein of unknown function [Georgfuchsia toluolica]
MFGKYLLYPKDMLLFLDNLIFATAKSVGFDYRSFTLHARGWRICPIPDFSRFFLSVC